MVFNTVVDSRQVGKAKKSSPPATAPSARGKNYCSFHGAGKHSSEECNVLRAKKESAHIQAYSNTLLSYAAAPSSSSSSSSSRVRFAPSMKQQAPLTSLDSPLRCFVCGLEGHMANACPDRARKSMMLIETDERVSVLGATPSANQNPSHHPYQILSSMGPFPDVPTLLDTGSSVSFISQHLSEALQLKLSPVDSPIKLCLGDGHTIDIPPKTPPTPIRFAGMNLDHEFMS